ncbi:hypothetical protein [Pollutimonas bauzanensis]|uniref:Uncharacterized protein n=1 Tax=Pollutimonas bauzanensis TaxID=658167 RepID=A0A1M5MTU4_9BURK|nr:hypothetical protein [Pollutimonas bauzanensis]SHG80790.1 hypothetical protein SAMN04488135_101323 [Pollutimonas bauzanensis]
MSNAALKEYSTKQATEKAERALSSAAGAATYAEGVELLLEMSDEQLGRRLKSRISKFRRLLSSSTLLSEDDSARGGGTVIAPLDKQLGTPLLGEDTVSIQALSEQAQRNRRALVRKKALISSAQLWQALSLTRQAVSAATRSGRLFTVDVEGDVYYPAFFADGSVDRATLEKVSRQLGRLPGWTKWDFFTSARGSLSGMSALDALRKGKVDDVMRSAKAFAEEASR